MGAIGHGLPNSTTLDLCLLTPRPVQPSIRRQAMGSRCLATAIARSCNAWIASMEQGAASRATSQSLNGADILGAGAFGATTLRKGHLLPLPQFVEAYALDARRVEEQ